MSDKLNPETNLGEKARLQAGASSHGPMVYQIRLKGHLGQTWTDWFEGLTITLAENGDTLLTGLVADQAALYGLLRKARDLGMSLLSVNRVEPDLSTVPPSAPQAKKETLK